MEQILAKGHEDIDSICPPGHKLRPLWSEPDTAWDRPKLKFLKCLMERIGESVTSSTPEAINYLFCPEQCNQPSSMTADALRASIWFLPSVTAGIYHPGRGTLSCLPPSTPTPHVWDKNSLNIAADLHWDAETKQLEGPVCPSPSFHPACAEAEHWWPPYWK